MREGSGGIRPARRREGIVQELLQVGRPLEHDLLRREFMGPPAAGAGGQQGVQGIEGLDAGQAAPPVAAEAMPAGAAATVKTFAGQPIRMPRFLKNPRAYRLSAIDTAYLVRTPADTCGLYTWAVFTVSDGGGPVPHVHYSDNEWFLTENHTGIRIFMPKTHSKPLIPGEIPGLNVPAQETGSGVIPANSAMYSPRRVVHYYTNESGKVQSGFHNIWEPGLGMLGVLDAFDRAFKAGRPLDRNQLMLETGLWGIPHDSAGGMVGTSNFRQIRGPMAAHENHLAHLQKLIDDGEKCFPASER
ncbi:MAG: hypothetical protein ACKO5F_15350 [Synechococcus sp.]